MRKLKHNLCPFVCVLVNKYTLAEGMWAVRYMDIYLWTFRYEHFTQDSSLHGHFATRTIRYIIAPELYLYDSSCFKLSYILGLLQKGK